MCNEVYQGRLTFGGCSCSPLWNATFNKGGQKCGSLARLTDGVVFSVGKHKTREYDANTGEGSVQELAETMPCHCPFYTLLFLTF